MTSSTEDTRPAAEVLEHAGAHLQRLADEMPTSAADVLEQRQALIALLLAEVGQARLADRIAGPFVGLMRATGNPDGHHTPGVQAALRYARTICPTGCSLA